MKEKFEPKTGRFSFAQIREMVDIPYLLDMQQKSYEEFLQIDVPPEKREDKGLQGIFLKTFPITNHEKKNREPDLEQSKYILEFIRYDLDPPQFTPNECRERGLTYGSNLRVTLRLTKKIENPGTAEQEIDVSEEQEVYFGDIPLMLSNGSFIINGAERVVVGQLHRSPGLFVDSVDDNPGKEAYSARLIPYDGSWIEFSIDRRDLMYISIDRKKKIYITTFLRALGYEKDEEILDLFSEKYEIDTKAYPETFYQEMTLARDLKDEAGTVVGRLGQRVDADVWNAISHLRDAGHPDFQKILIYAEKRHIKLAPGKEESLRGYIRNTIFGNKVKTELDEVAAQPGDQFTMEIFNKFKEQGVENEIILFVVKEGNQDIIAASLEKDNFDAMEKALARVYGILRPGSPATIELAESLIYDLFFNPRTYNLGE
ncbi:MAG TPA: hypothetical protein PLL34_07195, partial [Candidatus Mcinerneyibacteriales bacterium]|nr:hypothetical protein [Candidatus Mcinerneyibacteriales bacterium]